MPTQSRQRTSISWCRIFPLPEHDWNQTVRGQPHPEQRAAGSVPLCCLRITSNRLASKHSKLHHAGADRSPLSTNRSCASPNFLPRQHLTLLARPRREWVSLTMNVASSAITTNLEISMTNKEIMSNPDRFCSICNIPLTCECALETTVVGESICPQCLLQRDQWFTDGGNPGDVGGGLMQNGSSRTVSPVDLT